jgi:hypothetical protein
MDAVSGDCLLGLFAVGGIAFDIFYAGEFANINSHASAQRTLIAPAYLSDIYSKK